RRAGGMRARAATRRAAADLCRPAAQRRRQRAAAPAATTPRTGGAQSPVRRQRLATAARRARLRGGRLVGVADGAAPLVGTVGAAVLRRALARRQPRSAPMTAALPRRWPLLLELLAVVLLAGWISLAPLSPVWLH